MVATKVIHINQAPDEFRDRRRLPLHEIDGFVYIGRPSKWGNDWSHLRNSRATKIVATREKAVLKFKEWITGPSPEATKLRRDLPEIKGRTLICWCKPQACHGDVLAELADASEEKVNGE